MNWKSWGQGLVSALATAIYLVIVSMAALKDPPNTAWQWFLLAGVPGLKSFFDWLKDHPPGASTRVGGALGR